MSETAFVLIVEQDTEQADRMAESLREHGHACRTAQSATEAIESLQARPPDVIVADQGMATEGDGSSTRPLGRWSRIAPDAEVLLIVQDLPPEAISRLKSRHTFAGVLARPVSPDALTEAVEHAAEQARQNRANRALKQQAERRCEFEGLVTGNEQMIRLIHRVRRVADSKLTVLVLGESGTGKELVAQALHRHSPRARKAFRAINCAGLNENLLESELFGHVKGAFTGAVSDRKGLFEVVDSGTLFLDEVGDMPLAMQAKLLRTLENGEILPVGSNEIRKVDVRVVSATRRNLQEMVEHHEFRDDLFYRLNQATIRIPPLRERRDDVPILIDHFLHEAADVHNKPVVSVSGEVLRKLSAYRWPGNVRELRSVVDQMIVLAEGHELTLDDLPEAIRGSTDIVLASAQSTAGLTMQQMEKLHIANTLKLTGGNRDQTAKMLGIGARTLYRKLREYGLQ